MCHKETRKLYTLSKRLSIAVRRVIMTALITAVFVSFFISDPGVVTSATISRQGDHQMLIAELTNENILSVIPFLFEVKNPKISANFFTLIQGIGGHGSIDPCWINGTQNGVATVLHYKESVPIKFDLSSVKSAVLNQNLQGKYNVVSYVRLNYSYAYQNRLSRSGEKDYSGAKVYMLYPESTSTISIIDGYATGESPIYPLNIIAYPDNLLANAPVPGFSPLRNAQDIECLNYIVKNELGLQYQITN